MNEYNPEKDTIEINNDGVSIVINNVSQIIPKEDNGLNCNELKYVNKIVDESVHGLKDMLLNWERPFTFDNLKLAIRLASNLAFLIATSDCIEYDGEFTTDLLDIRISDTSNITNQDDFSLTDYDRIYEEFKNRMIYQDYDNCDNKCDVYGEIYVNYKSENRAERIGVEVDYSAIKNALVINWD